MSPAASGAGYDCTEARLQRKLSDYRAVLPELDAQGIDYKLMTFSTWGRPHLDVAQAMDWVARQAARRRGMQGHGHILRRWRVQVATQWWMGASRMVLECLPPGPADTDLILHGEWEMPGDDDERVLGAPAPQMD